MRLQRYPRLRRILFLLALCQVMVPSVAAVADAWRLDQRQGYAHIESESGNGCPLVHSEHCAVCAFTGNSSAEPVRIPPAPLRRAIAPALPDNKVGRHHADFSRPARQRAPPVA